MLTNGYNMAAVHARSAPNQEKVKIGFIGTGLRGRNHIRNLLLFPDVIIPAICDPDPRAIEQALGLFREHGISLPEVYTSSEFAHKKMLEKERLDGLIISSTWNWHTSMAVDAMKAGVFTGIEVSGAFALEDCWEWVNTHEQSGTHLMLLENVCYRRDVMAVMNMIQDNIFGELVHCRGGYLHDLRKIKFSDGEGGLVFGPKASGEARWRTHHSLKRNGDLYPTHGLCPIFNFLNINRGNRLVRISSMATKARSLNHYIRKHKQGGDDHSYASLIWQLGDVVTSMIECMNGESIILTHDTNLPRPYSLGFRVQGVEGLIDFDKHTQRIYIENSSPAHQWENAEVWLQKYDHPIWKEWGTQVTHTGHGGMDFFLNRAFVACAKGESDPPIDVYDAATLRAITPLSEASIEAGGEPKDIPDFTRGKWKTRTPIWNVRPSRNSV